MINPKRNNERSFFQKLTGSIHIDDNDVEEAVPVRKVSEPEEETEGELTVDVYQTGDAIYIQAMLAGVATEDLDISITHEMVTIKGHREPDHDIPADSYFYRELYWGAFTRTIILPQEIDPEEAEASEKHGLLTVRLPVKNKGKIQKLKVRSN